VSNNVFANGLEIACKAADGLSNAAFPDPCFTPPPPNGGWVLVPYPNTAFAKDLANGSTTVFISGLQVAKKDESFIKTSTGNEPAAGPMGKKTGVKKGKAYFTSWSMDVKVEGKNVCRHTDGMTHNHASWSGNTSDWVYLDTAVQAHCKKACDKIEKACGKGSTSNCFSKANDKNKETKKENETLKAKKTLKKKIMQKFNKWAKENDFTLKPEKTWKNKHCFPELIAKPGGIDQQIKAFDEQINKVEKTIQELPNKLSNINQLVDWKLIASEAVDAIIPNSPLDLLPTKYARRVKRIVNYPQQSQLVADAMSDAASEITNIFKNTQDFLDNLKNQRNLLEIAQNASPDEIAKIQEAAVKKDKCLQARKCLLEPYNKSLMPTTLASKNGCCPGQTAHHIIPDSYFKSDNGNIPDCDKGNPTQQYTHGGAPTVCAEGGNATGSHGKMHTLTDKFATEKIKGGELTYEDAKKSALEAHAKTFGGGCGENNACIAAQLDNYFKKKCSKSDFRVSPKKTTPGGGWLDNATPYPTQKAK
jgi:hypothetical protein